MKLVKLALSILILVSAASGASASGRNEAPPPGKDPEGGRIAVTVVPGEHYSHRKWFFLIPVKLTPTMAVWAEDEQGRFIGTLHVTKKAAEGSWTGASERPEALPVYFGRRAAAGKADASSGATPKTADEIRIGSGFDLPPGTYRIFAEVNSSFDYNDAYPEAAAGVNGQPSLIYSGRLVSGFGPAKANLVPVGKGDTAGRSGGVTEGLGGLTTALGIIDAISVEVRD